MGVVDNQIASVQVPNGDLLAALVSQISVGEGAAVCQNIVQLQIARVVLGPPTSVGAAVSGPRFFDLDFGTLAPCEAAQCCNVHGAAVCHVVVGGPIDGRFATFGGQGDLSQFAQGTVLRRGTKKPGIGKSPSLVTNGTSRRDLLKAFCAVGHRGRAPGLGCAIGTKIVLIQVLSALERARIGAVEKAVGLGIGVEFQCPSGVSTDKDCVLGVGWCGVLGVNWTGVSGICSDSRVDEGVARVLSIIGFVATASDQQGKKKHDFSRKINLRAVLGITGG